LASPWTNTSSFHGKVPREDEAWVAGDVVAIK
jgi:hypothetical protein